MTSLLSKEVLKLRELESSTKGFRELFAEIIEPGKCSYCMECVERCREEGRDAIKVKDEMFFLSEEDCTYCGYCYTVCPEVTPISVSIEKVGDLGEYLEVTSAVTRDRDIKRKSTDGGVVTSLLIYMLDKELVDGVVVAKDEGSWTRRPSIATTKEEVMRATGFRPERRGTIAGTPEVITNTAMLSFLRMLHRDDPKSKMKLALVGLPCEVYSVRKMQATHVAPADNVEYLMGLFCFETISLDGWRWTKFEALTGIPLDRVEKMNMREDLVVTLKGGDVRHVPLEDLSQIVNANCLRCFDYSSTYADVSIGGYGSEPGFNTVILRTERGKDVFESAVKDGYVMRWEDIFNRGPLEAERNELLLKIKERSAEKRRAAAKRTKRTV